MALFFDQDWFEARLKELGVSREDLARHLRLTAEQMAEVWKDQRELRAHQVSAMAKFLNVAAADVASRAGVSTPAPGETSDVHARLDEMNDRLEHLERMMVELKTLLLTVRS
jgi:transcriptional regulator with XRE-family HTH domain